MHCFLIGVEVFQKFGHKDKPKERNTSAKRIFYKKTTQVKANKIHNNKTILA